MSLSVLPVFPSKSFIVSYLAFRSLIHFVFVYGIRKYSHVILLHAATTILEQAMAPHSSTLAWKIPWMEEPGGPQSMGSLRVGHD